MKKILLLVLLLMPGIGVSQTLSQQELIGDWVWLGNAFTATSDHSELIRTGPSIKRFLADGEFQYISISDDGQQAKPVIGTWQLSGNTLSITRPDNGTFEHTLLSFNNNVLETQDNVLAAYSYMEKKSD